MPMAPDILSTIARMAANLQASAPAGHQRIWHEVRPWLTSLLRNAGDKWLPRLVHGFECQVPEKPGSASICRCPSVAACDVCQKPCCLRHARIDHQGDAICFVCVAEAMARKRGVPPGAGRPHPSSPTDAELEWAAKKLGVDIDAGLDEIKSAHRKLSAKHHPDRKQSASAKAKAEERFKEIQRAFELLKSVRQEAA